MRPNDDAQWLRPALLVVFGVTAMRLALMSFNRTDLFVDEAQYWFWGQEIAFGYYSKPPLIAWVIRAATELAGSDLPFFVRLPAPILHAATALLIASIAAPRFGATAAFWTVALYITLPVVSVGSYMISTDTIMFPFLALALICWMRCLDRGGPVLWAVAAGAALGVAFLAKYAAIYYALCAGLAAAVMWQGRPGWRAAGAALAAFLVVISPNLIWNLANGLSTIQHTMDNADWVRDPGARAQLNLVGLAEFFGAQFGVFGPVLFAGWLGLAIRFAQQSAQVRLLLLFSIPVLVVVCVQATLNQAYANWGVAAYLAGLVVVVPWLLRQHGFWLWGTVALHGAIAVLIPVAAAFGTQWTSADPNHLLLERYLGRSEMSEAILSKAMEEDLPIVADNRDILADLFYTGRDTEVQIYARPVRGRAPHHYALTRSMPSELSTQDVLFVSSKPRAIRDCPTVEDLGTIAPETGAHRKRHQSMWRVPANCLIQ